MPVFKQAYAVIEAAKSGHKIGKKSDDAERNAALHLYHLAHERALARLSRNGKKVKEDGPFFAEVGKELKAMELLALGGWKPEPHAFDALDYTLGKTFVNLADANTAMTVINLVAFGNKDTGPVDYHTTGIPNEHKSRLHVRLDIPYRQLNKIWDAEGPDVGVPASGHTR